MDFLLSHLGLLSQVLVPVGELVVRGLLLEVLLVEACESLFLGKLFVGNDLASVLLFIQKVLSFLGLHAGLFAVLVVFSQILLTDLGGALQILFELVEFKIFLFDRVNKLLILVHILVPALLNLLLEFLILTLEM